LEPGSFYTEPADAPHFALTQDGPATVYITGFGPTDTHYIDAAADPDVPHHFSSEVRTSTSNDQPLGGWP
jgi:hypothetical protein